MARKAGSAVSLWKSLAVRDTVRFQRTVAIPLPRTSPPRPHASGLLRAPVSDLRSEGSISSPPGGRVRLHWRGIPPRRRGRCSPAVRTDLTPTHRRACASARQRKSCPPGI